MSTQSSSGNGNMLDNIGSLVRLAMGWLSGYLAGRGVVLDTGALGDIIIAAVPVITAAWAWWHNRSGSTGLLSH
jgi:hypothetical protein